MDGAHDGRSRLHQLGTASLPKLLAATPAKAHPLRVRSALDLPNHLESYFAGRPISYPTQLQSIHLGL